MNETSPKKSGWRWLRRLLIGTTVFITLIGLLVTEENWRGKHAWENYQRELEAEGAVLDWNQFIPPPVPEDQNFFAAPSMKEWFQGHNRTDLLEQMSKNPKTSLLGEREQITNEIQAKDYLTWSDQFAPTFDLTRNTLKRPFARMDGDYSVGYQIPIPNFVMERVFVQMLAQRAHCHLLLDQPEKALDELTLLNDSRRLLLGAPTEKPMTLVAAMINVAVIEVYTGEIADGLQRHAWNESQLLELQTRSQKIELKKYVVDAFKFEQRSIIQTFTSRPAEEIAPLIGAVVGSTNKLSLRQKLKDPFYLFYKFLPRGWVYQNVTFAAKLEQRQIEAVEADPTSPGKLETSFNEIEKQLSTRVPLILSDKFVARIAVPNFLKAAQTTTHNQTLANEAQIACALERYRLVHGEYPETLDEITPKFITQVPHDIINGQPLHYRREANGQFILYSVGWNETDDGGTVVVNRNGVVDREKGDWVWQYPTK